MRRIQSGLLALSLALGGIATAWATTDPVVSLAGSPAHALSASSWGLVQKAPDAIPLGTSGKGVPHLVVFLDPNCSLCHRLYTELQPELRAHRVSVRIIPVGLIRPSSLGKAAHMEEPFLEPGDKTSATQLLAEDEDGFQNGSAGGHISPVSNPVVEQIVQEHNLVLERLTAKYSGFPRGRLETPDLVVTLHGVHRVLFGAPPQGVTALLRALN